MIVKHFDLSTAKDGPLRHEQLDPEWEWVYRQIWKVVGPFQKFKTWEQFEVCCLRNEHQESDLPFFAYVCGRFEDYKRRHPHDGFVKLQRVYNSIVHDYFKANPYVDIVSPDGSIERRLMKGYSTPTEERRTQAFKIGAAWLLKIAEQMEDGDIPDGPEGAE